MQESYFLFNGSSVGSKIKKKLDTWGKWSDWTACSRSCGGGRQSRMRECEDKDLAIIHCSGEKVQIRECNTHECPGKGTQVHNYTLV